MTRRMTDDRLFDIIETWGAEPHGWPEAERAEAEALLAEKPGKFSSALIAARELDLMLAVLPEPDMPRALTEAIIATAPKPARGLLPRWGGLKAPWVPASGFAAAAFGLFMGLTIAPVASADDEMNAEVQELVISALGFEPANYTLEEME